MLTRRWDGRVRLHPGHACRYLQIGVLREGKRLGGNRKEANVMAHTEPYAGATENPSVPDLTLPGLAALGTKNIEGFAKAQSELLSVMQDAHRRWFDRVQAEADLASEFTRKVTNCRSIPDAVAACQEWTSRRLELIADDSQHLLTDSRKVMERSARLLSEGLFAKGTGGLGTEEAAPSVKRKERGRSAESVSRGDAAWN
jgi:hypothetical protein